MNNLCELQANCFWFTSSCITVCFHVHIMCCQELVVLILFVCGILWLLYWFNRLFSNHNGVVSPFPFNSHITFGSHSSSQYLLASTTTHLLVWNMLTCTSKRHVHVACTCISTTVVNWACLLPVSSAVVYQGLSQSPCLRSLQLCSSSIYLIRLWKF